MVKNDIELEKEMDAPENWVSNRVLVRDGKGRPIEVETPDDEDGDVDAGNS